MEYYPFPAISSGNVQLSMGAERVRMTSIIHRLSIAGQPYHAHSEGDGKYWFAGVCPNCGPTQYYMIAATVDGNYTFTGETAWLRCPTCRNAAAINSGVLSPTAEPLLAVDGLPAEVHAAWEEVRRCAGVAAHTASVMMCRKILFHIAVEKGLAEKNDNGRAPNFTETLDHLKAQGLVTPVLTPWVEHIKDVGNEANHDLPEISAESAQRVATFTRQLLVLTYEMPAQMKLAVGVPGESDESPVA